MKARFLRLAIMIAAASAAMPAAAQEAADQPEDIQRSQIRQVIIYGNDACPPSTGDEIIVCARRPETERYRLTPEAQTPRIEDTTSALERDLELREVTNVGIGSCSTVGPGGASGCILQSINRSRVGKDGGAAPIASGRPVPEEPR